MDGPSKDLLDVVEPILDMFDVVDHEVLMNYMDEEERGPREVMLDRAVLTDFMFQKYSQFSRNGLENLLQMIPPILTHQSRKGGGLEPHIQLQAELNHPAGLQFQRTTGLTYGVSQNNARECLVRVVDALFTLKDLYIYMPNVRERYQISEKMFEW